MVNLLVFCYSIINIPFLLNKHKIKVQNKKTNAKEECFNEHIFLDLQSQQRCFHEADKEAVHF